MSEKRHHRHGGRGRPHGKRYSNNDDDDEQPRLSQNQRRRKAAISLNSFSSKKGHDRALQEYKKRKETKFQQNAVLLREYQRAMKAEGYEVGKGASRKRTRTGDDDEDNNEEDDKKRGADDEGEAPAADTMRKKRHRSDPLRRAREEAERRKAEQAELTSQREARQKTESEKQQGRKKRAKKMMQRTRRGQPLMKNVIGDLLGKIKNDVGGGGDSK